MPDHPSITAYASNGETEVTLETDTGEVLATLRPDQALELARLLFRAGDLAGGV